MQVSAKCFKSLTPQMRQTELESSNHETVQVRVGAGVGGVLLRRWRLDLVCVEHSCKKTPEPKLRLCQRKCIGHRNCMGEAFQRDDGVLYGHTEKWSHFIWREHCVKWNELDSERQIPCFLIYVKLRFATTHCICILVYVCDIYVYERVGRSRKK